MTAIYRKCNDSFFREDENQQLHKFGWPFEEEITNLANWDILGKL